MKRAMFVLAASGLMSFLSPATRPAEALDLVKDGKPCAAIVLADNAGNYQKWAAQWLQEYVKKASGAQLPIVSEGQAPYIPPSIALIRSEAPAGAWISVGHTRLAEKEGIKTDDLKYDGCKLIVKGNVLYLIGRDYVPPAGTPQDGAPNPNSSRPQGTVRAATTFLEDFVGVRWFLPGPEGTVIPSVKDASVPDKLDKKVVPMLAYATTGYDTPIAMYANNGRSCVNFKLYGGDGTWEDCVPGKQYYAQHPEYFRMDETGKRVNPGNDEPMLCTSNREVWNIMLAKLRGYFDQGYDGVELGQSDGWKPCLCPACQKEFGDGRLPMSYEHPAERIWVMHKWLCDQLAKSHPDKKVIVTVYGPTEAPSRRFDSLPDNAVLEMASATPDDPVWRGKFKACVVYDTYIWEAGCASTGFVPGLSPDWLQTRAKMWRDYGAMGAYGGGRGACWGLGGPSYYAYAKLAADPDLNMDKLLTEYCDGIYGESGPVMERFFRLLHSRSTRSPREPGREFENGYVGEAAFTSLYPPLVVNQLDALLKKAEARAKSDRAKGWLKLTRDSFDGLKTVADMFAAKRAFDLQSSKEMLQLVKERVDAFEKWRATIIAYSADKAYIRRWFPSYNDSTSNFVSNLICGGDDWDYLRRHPAVTQADLEKVLKGQRQVRGTALGPGTVIEPITWDFDKMMANIGKPPEERAIHVRRTAATPGPDGALDPKAWAEAQPVSFEPYHAGNSVLPPERETSVRALYDGERLHVRFECGEPKTESMILKSVGRDGDVYHQDEVELFLNPERSPRKFLHLMAAPVKDALYDARLGYIADPTDPRYNEPDTSWNADWTYTYNIDKEKKLWVLEMSVTFKSLGVDTPKPGTAWTANFARARRADRGEELTCWIAEEFGDPALFGEMTFSE